MWPCPACAANHLKAPSISRPPPISNRPGEVFPGVLAATSPIAKYSYAGWPAAAFADDGAAVDAHATKHAASQRAIERFRRIADTSPSRDEMKRSECAHSQQDEILPTVPHPPAHSTRRRAHRMIGRWENRWTRGSRAKCWRTNRP